MSRQQGRAGVGWGKEEKQSSAVLDRSGLLSKKKNICVAYEGVICSGVIYNDLFKPTYLVCANVSTSHIIHHAHKITIVTVLWACCTKL